MKQALSVFAMLLLFSFAASCDEEKPPKIDFEDPGRYYVINLEYTWIYARLGLQCVVSPEDTIVVTAQRKATRLVEGVSQNGWDLVSGGGGTGFVYRVADTIFYWLAPSPRELSGPTARGTISNITLRDSRIATPPQEARPSETAPRLSGTTRTRRGRHTSGGPRPGER
jgi:hypothetical protein